MLKKISIACAAIVLVFAFTSKDRKEVILTKLAPSPIGPYSQAIKTGGTLYVSGQVGLKPDGTFDTTSIENESTQALNNIKAIVEAAGMSLDDVSKATIYLTDIKNFAKVNDVYKSYFKLNPPARETVEVKALPKGAHVEISVIAN
ncbi:MAG: Rid family detoxifying hydrolase [Bacteroidota bacterium]|nr:Rid family detoxifying hydrolase [Bacteroidota bacterium]